MRSRLANTIDLIAGDVIYHPQCKVEFLCKAKEDHYLVATGQKQYASRNS